MVSQTPSEIEQLLDGNAWLTSGQIAALLGRSRSTMWRRLRKPDVHWRATPGGVKEYDPEDVRRLLDESRRVHGGEA